MKFVRRNPTQGYYDNYLWLPKPVRRKVQMEAGYTYFDHRKDELIRAYSETPDHWLLPRNAFPLSVLGRTKFRINDVRFRDFPRVNLKSSTVLDFLDPSKTFQREGCAALLRTGDGILSIRCGGGKSRISLHAAAELHVPVLILVDDKGIAAQWIENIREIYGLRDDEIGRFFGGNYDWKKVITVATVQSIAGRTARGTLPAGMVHHFGIVIADEVHVMGAPYFSAAIPPFHGRRWGLSATPTRDDGFDSLLSHNFGNVVYSYLMPELQASVVFRRLPTRVNVHSPLIRDAVCDKNGKVHNGKMWGHFSTLDTRNKIIAEDIKMSIAKGRKVLVLTHSRNMCEVFASYFGPEARVTHGGVSLEDHNKAVREGNPLIAIMKRGKQALDKPDLDTIVVVEPTTKPQVLQQVFGRALRDMRRLGVHKAPPMIMIYEDINVDICARMCSSIRRTLNRWPANKGGRIRHTTVGGTAR